MVVVFWYLSNKLPARTNSYSGRFAELFQATHCECDCQPGEVVRCEQCQRKRGEEDESRDDERLAAVFVSQIISGMETKVGSTAFGRTASPTTTYSSAEERRLPPPQSELEY